jgi:threonine/homoserine/homoserine lactone efflux protein
MLPLTTIFFTSIVIAFSGAMMPGPLLTVTISESSKRGTAAGPLLISGHAILELVLVFALLMGLGPVLKHDLVFIIVALAGGSIMLWMAWGMFRSLPTLSIKSDAQGEQKNNLLLSGALLSLANPYWIIWWATIGIGYIVFSQNHGIWGVLFFFIGHITGDFIWYTAVSMAVSKGKKIFTDRTYRVLIAICGSFLVGFAIYLVVMTILKLI